MNPIDKQLQPLGYSDCFIQDGDRWGYLNDGVMPQPVPPEIIKAIEEEDRRDRLAEWPQFSRRQKLRFWCDRVRWNLSQSKLNGGKSLKIGNASIPTARTLVLGEHILYLKGKDQKPIDGCDVLYSLAYQQGLKFENVHSKDWPTSCFAIDPNISSYERALVTVSRDLEAYNELSDLFKQNISTWIISRCDRELATVMAEETGYPASYFYGLPCDHFWVYQDGKLILGRLHTIGEKAIVAAMDQLFSFRPGIPELCGLVVAGGAIATGAGAEAILVGLFNVVFLPRGVFRLLSSPHRLWGQIFESFPIRLRSLAIIAMIVQLALIFGEGTWVAALLAPLTGVVYSAIGLLIIAVILFKIACIYPH